jgi:hypothetical protein
MTTPTMTVIIPDPTGEIYGFPTYPWDRAPDKTILATRRQLAEMGKRKNRQDPVAQLIRPASRAAGRPLIAYLYDVSKAAPRRPWTPSKQAAVQKAADSRKRCGTCASKLDYVPKHGECNPCTDSRNTLGKPLTPR